MNINEPILNDPELKRQMEELEQRYEIIKNNEDGIVKRSELPAIVEFLDDMSVWLHKVARAVESKME